MTSEPLEETQLSVAFRAPRGVHVLSWTDLAGSHTARLQQGATVGSATANGVVVQHPTVSRLHAEFELRVDGLWLRDVGSRNGTYVDDVFIQVARVRDGAKIKLGSVLIQVNCLRTEVVSERLWPNNRFCSLVGESALMRTLFASLAHLAPLESSVLIMGETGTGKELVARAIHESSPRADRPFVVVDCAALKDTLLESELFGHAKGSFTGATSHREGAIEAADNGTVFLDEIGELPISMQPKLLRILESRTVRRIGETTHRKVNVRFICATHRDLLTMVNAGEFREDLYFRLAVLPINVPPLRKRPEDIALLVSHFLPLSAPAVLDNETLLELTRRPWRGNVRELRNFVERVLALGAIEALALSSGAESSRTGETTIAITLAPSRANESTPASSEVSFAQEFKSFREQWVDFGERTYVERILERHERNVAVAAQHAGVDRTYLYRLMRKHGL